MRFFYKIKIFVALAGIICTANSCTKDFKDLNTSPSLVTEDLVKPDNLLSAVQKDAIFAIPDLGRLSTMGKISEFAAFMASESSGYPFKNTDYNYYFSTYYRVYLINMNET